MWWSILLGVVFIDAMLILINHIGALGIILTWFPGRILLLLLSSSRNRQVELLEYAWAAHLIPVVFLCTFHLFLTMRRGREPRFECTHYMWGLCWLVAVTLMITIAVTIWQVDNVELYIAFGALAVLLNGLNVYRAPMHIQHPKMKFTWKYIAWTTVGVVLFLSVIQILIDNGHISLAGIISNVPLLSIVLLVGTSCKNTPETTRTTGQHIYMLSYQIWPSMAFIGSMLATSEWSQVGSISIAIGMMLSTILIQYIVIKPFL